MKPFRIKSTSKQSAECDPIILREGERTRLLFKPLMVDNPNNKDAAIRGYFVFQKKSSKNSWEDYKELDLNRLKAEEWIRLEIKSEELLKLVRELYPLYKIALKDGIPYGEAQYIKVKANLKELSNLSEADLKAFFQSSKLTGAKLVNKLLNYFANLENPQLVVDRLESLDLNDLKKFNALVSLSNLKKCLSIWNDNIDNGNESFWQQTFLDNFFILSQIFSFPILFIQGKPYVGGKAIDNKGGNLGDFLCKNEITKNAALIELKTPTTLLLGKKYRNNIYNISEELSGATVQLLNQRYSLYIDYDSITREMPYKFKAFCPQCVVIVGNVKKELVADNQKRSFELFRSNLKDMQVITYDELFAKIKNLIDLLEK